VAAVTEQKPTRNAPPAKERRGARESSAQTNQWSTWALLLPTLIVIAAFFLLPLYYIFMFSVALRRFSPTEALAALNGELEGPTGDLWTRLVANDVVVRFFGAELAVPVILVGVVLAVLLVLAVTGSRIRNVGSWVVGISFALLLAPFLMLPAGNNLLRLLQFTSEGQQLNLFFKSVSMAMTSSVIAVLIALPIAYFLAFCVQKTKYVWLLIVIAPFLTSYLLRIFAWKVILGDQGLINSGLMSLRVIGEPLSFLIYSQFTVIIVLTYAWVPFICLPIFLSLETMDRRLLEAAMDLGASRWQAFFRITLPIAAPGIIAAFLFVFIPSIGEYITPTLVGGVEGTMYGQSLAAQFVGGSFNWQYGSAMALFLLGVVLFITFATARFLRAGGGGVST
jgi:spermidine/putrescine transport system permease protein